MPGRARSAMPPLHMAASFLTARAPAYARRLCVQSLAQQPSCTSASIGRRCSGGQDALSPPGPIKSRAELKTCCAYRSERPKADEPSGCEPPPPVRSDVTARLSIQPPELTLSRLNSRLLAGRLQPRDRLGRGWLLCAARATPSRGCETSPKRPSAFTRPRCTSDRPGLRRRLSAWLPNDEFSVNELGSSWS